MLSTIEHVANREITLSWMHVLNFCAQIAQFSDRAFEFFETRPTAILASTILLCQLLQMIHMPFVALVLGAPLSLLGRPIA